MVSRRLPKRALAEREKAPSALPGDSLSPVALAALALAIIGAAALPIDLSIARIAQAWEEGQLKFIGSSELKKLIELSEAFAHGTGVAIILAAVLILDRYRKRCLPRLAALAFGAGIFADILKLTMARVRPRAFDFSSDSSSIWNTFTGSMRPIDPGSFDYSSIQSFPSAHAATSVGLAIGLTRLYPQGRAFFITLAVLACSQRIVFSAHWTSDVCWGAAAGFLIAASMTSPRLLGKWFDDLE